MTYEATARIAVDHLVKSPLERSACSPRKEMPIAWTIPRIRNYLTRASFGDVAS